MEPTTPINFDPILDEIAERLDDREVMADTPEVYAQIDSEIIGLCSAIDLLSGTEDTYERLVIEGEIKGRITARAAEAQADVRDFLSGRRPNLFVVR